MLTWDQYGSYEANEVRGQRGTRVPNLNRRSMEKSICATSTNIYKNYEKLRKRVRDRSERRGKGWIRIVKLQEVLVHKRGSLPIQKLSNSAASSVTQELDLLIMVRQREIEKGGE